MVEMARGTTIGQALAPPIPGRTPTGHRVRRSTGLLAGTLALLLVAGPAAANGGSDWPSSGGVGMRNHQPAATGPATDPGLEWRRESDDLDGWSVDGSTRGTGGDSGDLILSSNGDLIATTSREIVEGGEEVREGAVMALDAATGALQWATAGLDDSCRPAVADSGEIWAVQVLDDDTRQAGDDPGASQAIVALDPDTGEIVPGKRYTAGDGVPLNNPGGTGCGAYGLQIAADGAVLTIDRTGFDPTVRAINPDGTSRWAEVFDRGCGIQPWFWAPEAGDLVYVASRVRNESCPYPQNTMLALDLATGAVVDTLALPGPGTSFGSRLAQAVHPDGDLFVSVPRPAGSGIDEASLFRLDTEPLAIDWQLEIDTALSATDPECAALVCAELRDLAVAGDRLVAREGNRVVSIDATDGSLQWRDTTGATGPLVVDGAGNAYTGRLSGTTGPRFAVLSPSGAEIAELDSSGGLTGIEALGPIDTDGTMFGRDSTPGWFAVTSDAGPLAQCVGAVAPDAGFDDVVPNSTHDANIDCVVFYELAQGTGEATYEPSRSVSREQMASFIARLIDASDVDLPAAGSAFTDVAGVHADNVERLAAAGIVQGREPGIYDPKSPVRRDQMASFLVRAFEFVVDRQVDPADVAFTDIGGNTHEDNIRKVAGLEFTQGLTPTSYAPDNPVRRDQMASFLARTLETLVLDEGRIPARS